MIVDSEGIFGVILAYSSAFALSASALLTYFYLRRKKALPCDETPKLQMMESRDE